MAALRADLRGIRLQSRFRRRRPVPERLSGILAARRLDVRADPHARAAGLRRALRGSTVEILYVLLPRLHDDLEHGLRIQPLHAVDQAQQSAEPVPNLLSQCELQQAVSVE